MSFSIEVEQKDGVGNFHLAKDYGLWDKTFHKKPIGAQHAEPGNDILHEFAVFSIQSRSSHFGLETKVYPYFGKIGGRADGVEVTDPDNPYIKVAPDGKLRIVVRPV